MREEEIFYILGIEPTKDEASIKAAYRAKLTVTNPEDDPEGFKRLRQAYEEACSYARNREEEPAKEDTTASGLWVQKALALYLRFPDRCNKELWKKLFDEDIFVSFDGNEECRRKFLIFLMNHFNFPYEIWQLFDQRLGICEDSNKLKEEFPEDFVQFLVRRCTEKDSLDYALFKGPDEGSYDQFLNCYREVWNAVNEKNYDKARQAIENADETGISHPYMELVRALVYSGRKEEDKAEELFLQLKEQYPEDTAVLAQTANFYWEKERREEAVSCYLKLKELHNENYMANCRLAFYYYEKKDHDSAKACIELIPRSALGGELTELLKNINVHMEKKFYDKWKETEDVLSAVELARCYFQDERYFAAGKVLAVVKNKIPEAEKEDFLLLLTRVYIGQAEYEKAIETANTWKEGTDQLSRLKISAYHAMGRGFKKYFDKAVEEYEKIKDGAGSEPDILMEMAQIFLEKGDYQKCLDLASVLLEKYQIYYAYVFMLKAYAKLWDGAGVIRSARQCISYFPGLAYPYEEMAKVYYDTGHQEEMREILKLAEDNNVESIYLDCCAYHGEEVPEDFPINDELKSFNDFYHLRMVRTGYLKCYSHGYPVITKYLRMYPCNVILNRRGLFSMAAKETEAAMKDFNKILERDLADAFAYNNIGCLYKYSGEYEKALTCFNRAIYYMYREGKEEPTAVHYGNLAHTYELMGEYELAAKVYRRIYDEFQKGENTIHDLIANYARTGQIEKAEEIIAPLYRSDPVFGSSNQHRKPLLLYRAYLYAGDLERASRCIDQYKQILNYYGSSDSTKALLSKYHHMRAFDLLLKGCHKECLAQIDQAIADSDTSSSRKKDKIDVVVNKLFFLTFDAPDIIMNNPNFNMAGRVAIKDGAEPFWKKVFRTLKPQRPEAVTDKENDDQEAVKKAEIGKCLDILNKRLDQICRSRPEDRKERNPVATEDFFYKERYVSYLNFVLALYGQGIEEGKAALASMEESPRCRLCNHASCMRLIIAKALMAEQQGQKKEAVLLYESLGKEQPYNLYARAKLAYLKNEVGEES